MQKKPLKKAGGSCLERWCRELEREGRSSGFTKYGFEGI